MLTHARNDRRIGRIARWAATLALLAPGLGCADMNDNPAGGITAVVSFAGQDGRSPTGGLIESPSGLQEPIRSVVVGAIVITHTTTPYTDASQVDDEATREALKDDAIQSAAYLTIAQLPSTSNTVSFLIPPGTSGSWQLIGVGTRVPITVLNDFEDHPDAPIWYGFTPYFAGGPGANPANVIEPGEQVTLELRMGCNLPDPPSDCP